MDHWQLIKGTHHPGRVVGHPRQEKTGFQQSGALDSLWDHSDATTQIVSALANHETARHVDNFNLDL